MQKGTVKFFNVKKQFGFIIEDGTGRDIFFHISNTLGYHPGGNISFNEGESVLFDEIEGVNRSEAINVTRAEGSYSAGSDLGSDEDDAS